MYKLIWIYILGLMLAVLRYEHLNTLVIGGSYILYFLYSLVFLTISFVILFYPKKLKTDGRKITAVDIVKFVFIGLLLEMICYFYILRFLPDVVPEKYTYFRTIISISIFLLYSSLFLRNKRCNYLYLGGVIILAGLFFRLAVIRYVPFENAGITNVFFKGCRYFISTLDNPYRALYKVGDCDCPLSYLPVMWGVYLIGYLLHIDLRWLNILSFFVMGGLLLREAIHSNDIKRSVIIWVLVILNFSPYILLRHDTEFNVFSFFVGVFIYLWLRNNRLLSTIAMSVLVASSLLGCLFSPFYFISLWKEMGFKKIINHFLMFICIVGIFILPFLIWDPMAFIRSTFLWYQNIYKSDFDSFIRMFPNTIGFSYWFFKSGLQRFIQPIQIGILFGLIFLCNSLDSRSVVKLSLFYYLLFVMFNVLNWLYMYVPFLVGICVVLIMDYNEEGMQRVGISKGMRYI